jgi:hypothetical protein
MPTDGSSPSAGWRDVYEEMGVNGDGAEADAARPCQVRGCDRPAESGRRRCRRHRDSIELNGVAVDVEIEG